MGIFQGHSISSIVTEVFLALFWVALVYVYGYPKISRDNRFLDWFYLYIFILVMPNSTYALFELKHLFVFGMLADPLNTASFMVFGSVALLGLVLSIFQSQMLASHYAGKNKRLLIHLFVSLILGFGAVVGQMNYASIIAIIFPFALLDIAFRLAFNPAFILVALASSLFLFTINIFIDCVYKPSH